MTGYRSTALRHKCDRDGCAIEALPSWDWMNGCFPRGIRPSDLDGWVEINGHLLLIEQKRKGAFLEDAQRRGLLRLSRQPGVTVVFLRETDDPERFQVLIYDGHEPCSGWQTWALDAIRTWLTQWALTADMEAP